MLIGIFSSLSLLANQVLVGNFTPHNSEKNLDIEKEFRESLEKKLSAKNFKVSFTNDNRNTIFQNAKQSEFYIEGQYIKTKDSPLSIYIQIYDTSSGIVIDAISESLNLKSIEGIELDPNEINRSNQEIINIITKQIAIDLFLNTEKKESRENIQDHLISKPIYKKGLFPISQYDTKSEAKETFKLIEEQSVVTASRTKESQLDVPASTIVISEQDIKDRGYTSVDEILGDLPGMDTIVSNGMEYLTMYQRGYRTPLTQKTLLMINGIIDNDLFGGSAQFSRQYPVSNIKKIEIVYGPVSAVYGPNAFQGIINIITKDGKDLKDKSTEGKVSFQYGSFHTRSVDAGATAKIGDFTIAVSGKTFESNEPNLSNRGGYISNYWLANPKVWGPILYLGDGGKKFGKYNDPTNDWGSILHLNYKTLKFGLIRWNIDEGYGPYYAGDKSQPAAQWSKSSGQYYVENNVEVTNKLSSYTLLLYRDSKRYGNWAEATEDTSPGMKDYSYVSYTNWNTENSSVLINQNLDYKFTNSFKLIGGIKVEQKKITKNYDIPGYWDAYSSQKYIVDKESFPNGYGVVHSTTPFYNKPPSPKTNMPLEALIPTNDKGAFLVSILDINKFRFSPGIRYDVNSVYGQSINPRITAIYKYSSQTAFKLLYGEAFSEPAPIQLYGGWNGRNSNANMKPEKERTNEFIILHQRQYFTIEWSSYYSRYENVVKEEAENAGRRRIYGTEYKIQSNIPNIFQDSRPIGLYLYYTYTESLSGVYYDHNLKEWKNGKTDLGDYEYLAPDIAKSLPRTSGYSTLGDIASHKVNMGFNLPFKKIFNFNLRGSYIGKRQFYQRNPLRYQGKTLDPYFLFNCAFTINFWEHGFLTFKILNLLNHTFYNPGLESASAGDNYYERSSGFNNSIIAQPGRSFLLSMTFTF